MRRRSLGAACATIALLAVACGGAASTPAAPAAPVGAGTNSVACKISAGGAGSPIVDPSGPYYHQVVVARSVDGVTLSGAHQVLDHASVPDAVQRADGSVLLYYVNGAKGYVWVARLEGDTAHVLGQIAIDGIANPAGVVDPDATLLPDGRIRLAYYWGFGPPTTSATRAMCIAESTDGLNFTTKATAFTFSSTELLTDPSLLALPDGTWLMAVSNGQSTVLARSADGLSFTREATLPLGGVPELARAPDGALRLYACKGPIIAYRSVDAGRNWAVERTVLSPPFNGHQIVCDPSAVSGANLFVFKTG